MVTVGLRRPGSWSIFATNYLCQSHQASHFPSLGLSFLRSRKRSDNHSLPLQSTLCIRGWANTIWNIIIMNNVLGPCQYRRGHRRACLGEGLKAVSGGKGRRRCSGNRTRPRTSGSHPSRTGAFLERPGISCRFLNSFVRLRNAFLYTE